MSHFPPFSLFDNAFWFFIKSGRQIKRSNFKITFAPFLGSLQPADQIWLIYILRRIVLFGFLIKLAFELEQVNTKQILLLPQCLFETVHQIWQIYIQQNSGRASLTSEPRIKYNQFSPIFCPGQCSLVFLSKLSFELERMTSK